MIDYATEHGRIIENPCHLELKLPNAPLKACSAAGCKNRVVRGRCAEHARQTMREVDVRRGTFRQRGYDERWRKLSKMRLREFPMCADPFGRHDSIGCFADCTDHIVPLWAGGELLDPNNLQSLCTPCNLLKDRQDRKKYQKAVA